MTHPGYEATTAATQGWRKKLISGEATYLGCAVNTSSNLVAEMVASQGYDFVLVDAQHSGISVENLRSILQAVKAGGSRSIVRVGGHMDRIGIQQALDLGASGILIPCARTVEDIEVRFTCMSYNALCMRCDRGMCMHRHSSVCLFAISCACVCMYVCVCVCVCD